MLVGASGHGKVVADMALLSGEWQEIAFLDDNPQIEAEFGLQVVGKTTDAPQYANDYIMVVTIGNNVVRARIMEDFLEKGIRFATIIHPSAIIGNDVDIGAGSVVMGNAVINCCTKIGKGSIINTSATVDHDCVINDYVHCSPGVHVAGKVQVGDRTWLGIGSIVINNVSISSDCVIGAGAVVTKSISKPGRYIGVPARRMK